MMTTSDKWNRPKVFGLTMTIGILIYWSIQNHNEGWRLRSLEYIINGFNGSSSRLSFHQACFTGSFHENNASFVDAMSRFPWASYKNAFDKANFSHDNPEIQLYSTELLQKLLPFITAAPLVPINESCHPPLSEMPYECSPLPKPRKVGVLWQFGFDVDALEIHLNELDSLVDKFFITESIKTHNKVIKSKPLLWDMLKYDQRFAKFSEKIVYFIVDDASLSNEKKSDEIWSRERLQETLRWTQFLEWNEATKYFDDDDILGFGDVDELPSRNNVLFLKNCKFPGDSVDIGIWFPFDGTDTVFRSSFPVHYSHPYTLGDPTFYTLASAKRYQTFNGKAPSRRRGLSRKYRLGGMHLSRYAFPPFQMVKLLTATESDGEMVRTLIKVGMLYAENKSVEAEEKLNFLPESMLNRTGKLDTYRKRKPKEVEAIVKMPWFLQCNRERYPGFDKRHDSRLDRRIEVIF